MGAARSDLVIFDSKLKEEKEYWIKLLSREFGPSNLCLDYERPGFYTAKKDVVYMEVSGESFQKLIGLSGNSSFLIHTILLTTLKVCLHKHTGSETIVVGTPNLMQDGESSHRPNVLAIVDDIDDAMSFRQLLLKVRETLLEAYDRQRYPISRIIRDLGHEAVQNRCPLFDVLMLLKDIHSKANDLKNDITMSFEIASGRICGAIEYNVALFRQETIERFKGHFLNLLNQALTATGSPLFGLNMVTEDERRQLLYEWNATETEIPANLCIHHLFEAQVERSPQSSAVVLNDRKVSYGELNARANQLARYLMERGVGPDALVGIFVDRSIEMVVGVLGIFKAGGAYLPLDSNYPPDHIAFVLKDAAVGLILTERSLAPRLPEHDCELVFLDDDCIAIERQSEENPLSGVRPDNLAYVIYTSGSTGEPKGTLIEHRGVVNHAMAMSKLYDLHSRDRYLQFFSLSFDASAEDIFPTLMSGATIICHPDPAVCSASELLEFCNRQSITILHIPVAYWHGLVDNIVFEGLEVPSSIRVLSVGGEAPWVEKLRTWADLTGKRQRFINVYGPTETTITSTVYTTIGSFEGPTIPIGKPISNARINILDPRQKVVPIGVTGEVYISGVGVARGYLNRPALTAERFVPDPHGDAGGGRRYRTGDLARYLSNGNIEFVGRLDYQVKLRGYRIELQEIEATLARHEAVLEAVVLAREDAPGDKRLVAYVTVDPHSKPGEKELSDYLREKLPEHMVPAAFIILETFPLTRNGKVDRRALPAPDQSRPEQETCFVAARTPIEESLTAMWSEILKLERVGVYDDFFRLGGHSLLATQAVSRLRKVFGVEIALRQIFETPTAAGLAAYIEEALRDGHGLAAPAIEPVARDSVLRLSFGQQRLWFFDQLEPENNVYSISSALRLTGPLDVEALEKSLTEIVRRHEVLRTTIVTVDGQPRQIIYPPRPLTLERIDLSGVDERERISRAKRFASEEASRPFNLSQGPLIRLSLLHLADDDHLLLSSMHHIVSDGWSVGIFIYELGTLYGAYVRGSASPLEELPVQYADYAEWQRDWLQGEVLGKQVEYWTKQLEAAPPVLELPTDRPRPAAQTYNGAYETCLLPKELGAAIKALSRQEGATEFMVLLAGFQTLLKRYTGQDDFCVGTPIANRNRAEIEGLIGFFANTLVLRSHLSDNPGFLEAIRRAKDVSLGAYAHQDLPFEKLVEEVQPDRDLSHSPLFQVLFVLQNAPMEPLELTGLTLAPFETESATAKYDLSSYMADTPQGYIAAWEYNTNLFDAATIARMAEHFQTLLEGAVQYPERAISELPLMPQSQRRQLLFDWNDNRTDHQKDNCIHELFETQVEKTPEAIALVFDRQRLTYRELNQRANQMAHFLRGLGVGPEVLVAICVERGIEMIAGLLGILKAGGGYVPLDPNYPKERLALMLEDAGAAILLSQAKLLERLPETEARIVHLDCEWDSITQSSTDNPAANANPCNLAYVIYTSGSTGRPKGVAIEHQSTTAMLEWAREAFDRDRLAGVLASTSICFDLSVFELFAPLSWGGSVILVENALDVISLWSDAEVSLINTVPSAMTEIMRLGGVPASVRTVNLAGEPIPQQLVERVYQQAHIEEINNLYGPSEDTTYSTHARIGKGTGEKPTIGRPISNTQVYILDQALEPVPVGIIGEIYIGGEGLARGYLGRPELTAEKFIPDPFNIDPGTRLYSTGDRGRYRADKEIDFLGRKDHQIKLRGYRIELGEIESALNQHAAVREAVVIVREDEPGDSRLVAYLVGEDGAAPDIAQLKSYLRQKLPDYMVPTAFITLEVIPLTRNGKLDRRALPQPDQTHLLLKGIYVAPRDTVEEMLADIWAEVLKVERVGIHDNFFELGGHSLLATQVISRVREVFHVDLPLRSIFESPTVASLSLPLSQIQLASVGSQEIENLLESLGRISEEEAKLLLEKGEL